MSDANMESVNGKVPVPITEGAEYLILSVAIQMIKHTM
jgi:hypothetical protein